MTVKKVGLLMLITACGSSARPSPSPSPAAGAAPAGAAAVKTDRPDTIGAKLPPVPAVRGPLAISVIYPSATDLVDAKDSNFIFGSVGTGEATLSINGQGVAVAPNGTWIAWLPLPPDSVLTYDLTARTATDSAHLVYTAKRLFRFTPPASGVWIDSTSVTPRGNAWWPADEFLPVSVRAVEGAEVRVLLPNGTIVPLRASPQNEDAPWGVRAFDRDTTNLVLPRKADRYVGAIRGLAIGENPGPLLGPPPAFPPSRPTAATATPAPTAIVEAIVGTDTARATWNLSLALLDSTPVIVEFNDDTAHKGDTDSLTIGRTRPGATYHWFMPTGTRTVATGRLGDDLRVRLSRGTEAWVPAADALQLPTGTPALRATVSSVTLTPFTDRLSLRVPLSQRIPFRVEEGENELTLRLYNSLGDLDWMRYGGTDPYLKRMTWEQETNDEVTIKLDLAGPVWGYQTRWSRNDLIFEVRRPPRIDKDSPLQGRRIVVDPGHPPAGAMGPSGFREAQANLAVAFKLRELLQAKGATVIMTRTTDSAVDLWPRVKLADTVNAELLVSIHNNALPDGLNPFTNSGSSVFYNQPRSVPLAMAVQRALVRRLGIRDLGVSRGDLALVRPTWMPSILTEGLFMMLPEQEAALRSEAGQALYAQAVFDGIETFLRDVAGKGGPVVP
ncbi:MAG TPA: N-acetylmuramoyl-L-alanine amidase [Gemmatimonadales bacterium]